MPDPGTGSRGRNVRAEARTAGPPYTHEVGIVCRASQHLCSLSKQNGSRYACMGSCMKKACQTVRGPSEPDVPQALRPSFHMALRRPRRTLPCTSPDLRTVGIRLPPACGRRLAFLPPPMERKGYPRPPPARATWSRRVPPESGTPAPTLPAYHGRSRTGDGRPGYASVPAFQRGGLRAPDCMMPVYSTASHYVRA